MFWVKEFNFQEKKKEWEVILSESQTATFFQTWDWLVLWDKHFSGQGKIWGVFNRKKLIGLVPLEKEKNSWRLLGTREVLGGEKLSDFGDIVAKISQEREVWQAVLGRIRKEEPSSQIKFDFLREDSPSLAILESLGGKRKLQEIAPYLELPSSWEKHLSSLSRHQRHELRRKLKRWERETTGQVFFSENPKESSEFFRLLSISSPQKKFFLSEKMKDFFRQILEVFLPQKRAKLAFLKLGKKNIASLLLFFFREEVLLYNSGFDPNFAFLSPGLVLKALVIKKAIEEGKKGFDFLRGQERYKFDLGGKERKLYQVIF